MYLCRYVGTYVRRYVNMHVMDTCTPESVDLFIYHPVFDPGTKFVASNVLRAAPFHDVEPIVLRDLNPNGHISKGRYLRPFKDHAPADLLHYCKSFHCPI